MKTDTLSNILLWGIAIPGWFYTQAAQHTISDPDVSLSVSSAIVGAQLTALIVAVLLKTKGGN